LKEEIQLHSHSQPENIGYVSLVENM